LELTGIAEMLSKALVERARRIEMAYRDVFVDATPSNLDELVRGSPVVILFFTAEWCAPCMVLMNALKRASPEILRPGVVMARVDVDKSYSIAGRYGVQHIPAVVVLVHGKVVASMTGTARINDLISRIKEIVLSHAS